MRAPLLVIVGVAAMFAASYSHTHDKAIFIIGLIAAVFGLIEAV